MPPKLRSTNQPLDLIGYIRVSTAREEMISPEIQRSVITGWAERTGHRITDWVVDLDRSGRTLKRKIMKVIGRVEAGEASGVAVMRYDRWGRNATDSLANIRRVELVGGVVESASEPVDAETAIGRYSRTNALALAEMQSDLIGENWAAAHAYRRDAGLPASGRPRFGYIRLGRIPDPIDPRRTRRVKGEDEQYVPDYGSPAMLGHVLADLYCGYVAGATMRSLRVELNTAGIRNSYGRPWSDQALTIVLDAGFGAGLLHMHDPECRCRNAGRCRRYIHIGGAHEPVIDSGLWDAYRERRALVAKTPPRTLAPSYPLTGLVRCGNCHGSMTTTGQPGRPGYTYRCTRQRDYKTCPGSRPRRAAVEEAVLEALHGWAGEVDTFAAAERVRARARTAAQADAEQARRDLAAADRALVEILKQRAKNPDIPEVVHQAAQNDLLRDRADAEARLARADAEARQNTAGEDIRPIAAGLLAEWNILAPAERSALLTRLIRHVQVFRSGDRKPPRIVVTPVWEPCDCPNCTKEQADE